MRDNSRSGAGVLSGKILSAVMLAVFVLFPLVRMFASMSRESIRQVVSAPQFPTAVKNSLISASLATLIAVTLGLLAAVCLERTAIRGKAVFTVLLTLPMLIPSSSHGMGLILLLGNNGMLTRLLRLDGSIYGMKGIIVGSVLYAFPVAFLMLSDVMRYENGAPYEAARVLGITAPRRFWRITLPYLRKPIISALFAVFSMVVTDYGVPVMIGGKCLTVSRVMYEEVIGQLNFGKGTVYGAFLLVPAVLAFVADIVCRSAEASVSTSTPIARNAGRSARLGAYLFCGALSAFILLPLLLSVLMAFTKGYPTDLHPSLDVLHEAFRMGAGKYLGNSVVIALLTSLLGTVLAFALSYTTARMRSPLSSVLHLCSITSAAIPGIVLGLSYILAFKGSFLYGTLAILIAVNTVHFFASPYLMCYNSLSKQGMELEAVGATLGISRWRMVCDVILPRSIGTLLEMFSYFFVNCMMTISAVSFLADSRHKPVALMINQFQDLRKLEAAALVSVLILIVNLLLRGAVNLLRHRLAGGSSRRSSGKKSEKEALYESDQTAI